MTRPTAPARPVWKCADCDTNNDFEADGQCIVCGRDRPVSRVRINIPSPVNPTRRDPR
ncbi:hypothetical protein ACGF12_13765 [Kitasatospora sp. NPDC048296]|uniref:hypothetical protein n=1 Tax=Kitasatospora sp. NPDC048296 TaxID=3364048 RepID=UPI003719E1E5